MTRPCVRLVVRDDVLRTATSTRSPPGSSRPTSTWAVSAAPAGLAGRTRAVNRSSRLISVPDGGRRLDRAPNVTATSPAALSYAT